MLSQIFQNHNVGGGRQKQTVKMAMTIVSEVSGDIQDVNLHVEKEVGMKTECIL
jgi:hypothetical protein